MDMLMFCLSHGYKGNESVVLPCDFWVSKKSLTENVSFETFQLSKYLNNNDNDLHHMNKIYLFKIWKI